MSRQDAEVVGRLFEYDFRVVGPDGFPADHPFLALWHPECVLEELAEIPDAAAYHGREGIARYFEQIPEVWESFEYTPTETLDGPDGVFVATDLNGRSKAGVDTHLRVYQVFRVRDGMIVFASGYTDRERALAAVGLS